MKTAIKLVLIYFLMQLLSGLLLSPLMFMAVSTGVVMGLTLLLGCLLMTVYLWKTGYLQNDGKLYAPVSVSFLGWSLLAGASLIVLEEWLMSYLRFLPDLMEQSFDAMQSGWVGILAITLVGPILEELMFRGAITKVLLQRYSPRTAIIFSALIFGVFHLNPVQVVGASIVGLLLAWLYWRTGSLMPGILIHIFNNSLSVYLALHFPEVDYVQDLMPTTYYVTLLLVAFALLCYSLHVLNKISKKYRCL